jgi:hypothetical protein
MAALERTAMPDNQDRVVSELRAIRHAIYIVAFVFALLIGWQSF